MNVPNEKEQDLLVKFRSRLTDLDLSREIFQDYHLIRWLRARDLDISRAEKMLRKHLEWKDVNEIDTILETGVPLFLRNNYSYEVSGFDKLGCPVVVLAYGRWDVRKAVVTDGLKNECIRMIYCYLEEVFALQQQKSTGKVFKQFTVVADLEGLSFRQFTSVEIVDVILTCVRAFEANHPESLHTAFLINAPSIFSILWGMVKPFLSAHTLRKVQIFGIEPQKIKTALLKQIPIDQFAPKFGGTAVSTFNHLNVTVPEFSSECQDNSGFPAPNNKLKEVAVGAGDVLKFPYTIEAPQTTLSWAFKTNDFDIGFSLTYDDTEPIVSYKRVNSHRQKQLGSVICTKPGRYILSFDNTYSRMRSKVLLYAVDLILPEEAEDEKFVSL